MMGNSSREDFDEEPTKSLYKNYSAFLKQILIEEWWDGVVICEQPQSLVNKVFPKYQQQLKD